MGKQARLASARRTSRGPAVNWGPVVGAQLWDAVITAANARCECGGLCGRKHAKPGRPQEPRRCGREHQETRPLHAIPRDPATIIAAMQLPAERLIAVCDDCRRGIDTARARTARTAAAARMAAATPPLFGPP